MKRVFVPKYLGRTSKLHRPLKLHPDAVTQGFAILGKRGKGKSTLAGDMLELFAARGQSFVVLDPVDAHWGIRYAANHEGALIGPNQFEVLLVGGEHGDVPLDPRAGKELARTIVAGDISVVISLKALGFTERQRFAADFGEELLMINKTPRHIAFEEAQNFTPQMPRFEEQKRVLYFMEKIVTEGRGSGLGFSLISQRPALINKNVLEQTDNMFAMGMIGPNDLSQMQNWFKHHVKGKEKLEKIITDLAHMKMGECWFLSPDWQERMVRFNVRPRVTYHSGRTPKLGERSVNVKKFSVGQAVQHLKRIFAVHQAERAAEVSSLKEAQARIRLLEQELRKKSKVLPTVISKEQPKPKIDDALVKRIIKEEVLLYKNEVGRSREFLGAELKNAQKELKKVREAFESLELGWLQLPESKGSRLLKVIRHKLLESPGMVVQVAKKEALTNLQKTIKVFPRSNRPASSQNFPQNGNGNSKLGAGAKRMLAILVKYPSLEDTQWRSHAGITSTGTFSSYKSFLNEAGLITKVGNKSVPTEEGETLAAYLNIKVPENTEDILNIWAPKVGSGPMRILNKLIELEEPIPSKILQQQVGFESSGTFSSYLSFLRGAGLIYTKDGKVHLATHNLFL